MRLWLATLVLVGCSPHPAPNGSHGAMPQNGSDGSGGSAVDLASGGSADMGPVAQPGPRIAPPNPIISRGRPLTSSSGSTSTIDGAAKPLATLTDGTFLIGDGFAGGAGAWVGVDLGSGATRLLVSWLGLGSVDAPEAAPVDYHLDVSPDGTAWHTALTITGNDTNARAHSLDFTGQRYLRLIIDRCDAGGSAHLIELEVFDISHGSDDTWIVIGDSISAMSLNRWLVPDLPSAIHAARPGFFPMVIDEAIGGTNTTSALTRIDGWIARFPDVRNWIVAYGTNDGDCDTTSASLDHFTANLGQLVDKLQAAGKRVLVPHIPWNSQCNGAPAPLAPFNAAIDTLRAKKSFIAGPDLYSWFAAHQEQLGPDHTHPTADGQAAITKQWADAAASLYP